MSIINSKLDKAFKALKDKQEITAEDLTAVNAAVSEEGVTSVEIVVVGALANANQLLANKTTEAENLQKELDAAKKTAADWEAKYKAMPGAVHTQVETQIETTADEAGYDWTKANTSMAKIAGTYFTNH